MQENGIPQTRISFGEFELDTSLRRLVRDGEPVALYAKTFDLLELLIRRNGELVTKEEILDTIWAGQFVEEANLTVQISALRKALGETTRSPRFLVTFPGKGYKFVADILKDETEIDVHHNEEETGLVDDVAEGETKPAEDSGTSLEPAAPPSLTIPNRRYVLLGGLAGTIAFLALLVGGIWLFDRIFGTENEAGELYSLEKQPKIKRLTNHGRTDRAAMSRDGMFFAYTFREKGSYRTELRLGQTSGSSEAVLKTFEDGHITICSFSAEGAWLYYVVGDLFRNKGTLYKIPVLSGAPQKLAENIDFYPAISPDEKQIAFIKQNTETRTSSLVVADIDGGKEREITTRPLNLSFIRDSQTWSADGRLIALGAENGKSHQNASQNYHEIFVIRVADGHNEQLTSLEWDSVDTVEWIKDGSGLFTVARSRDRPPDGYQLWYIDYPGGEAKLFSRDVDTYGGVLAFAADSNSLLVVQREIEGNIWIASAVDLKQAQQITFSSSGRLDGWQGMDWTPDGQIVHTAWIDQSLTLWKMDNLGANQKQLTSTGFRDEKPFVSPDGKWAAFQSNRSGDQEIWRVSIDGGDLQQLTRSGGNSHPSISPDGNWIVYRHIEDGRGSVWRVPATGGDAVLVTDEPLTLPQTAPDGSLFAGALTVDGKRKLVVLSFSDGEVVRSFDVPVTANLRYWLRWTPDGRSITYPDEANGIWRQSIDGGDPKRIEGLPQEKIFSHAWSSDRRQLAFGRIREVRDAVLISNVH